MLRDLLSNLAFITVFLFLLGQLFKKKTLINPSPLRSRIIIGLLLGILAIILMIYSLHITNHVIVDLRIIPIVVAGSLGGVAASLATASITALFRITFFGVTHASVTAVCTILIIGLTCGWISARKFSRPEKYTYMLLSSLLINTISIISVIPNTDELAQILPLFILITLVGGLFVYFTSEYIIASNANFRKMLYYRIMADNIIDMISTHRRDSTFRYISPYCFQLLGYHADELMGRRPRNLVHPDDLEKIRQHYRLVLKNSKVPAISYRLKRKDGLYIWVETSLQGISDKSDEIKEIVCLTRNINDRKSLEKELLQSNHKISTILESIQDAFCALDTKWRFTYVNKESQRLMQKTAAELMGKSVWEVFPDAVGSKFYSEYHKVLKEQTPSYFEAFYPILNKWLTVSAYPTTEGISVYFRDITDQKEKEAKYNRTNALFKAIFEHAGVGIAVRDMAGKAVAINPAYLEMFGYDQAEVDSVEDIVHPNDLKREEKLVNELIDGCRDSYKMEKRYFKKSGTVLWTEIIATKLTSTTSEPEYVVSMIRDMTSRKHAEQRLKESESMFRSLVNSMNDIVFTLDCNQRCTGVYGSWVTEVGLTEAHFLGKTTSEIFGPENARIHEEANMRAIQGEHIVYNWSVNSPQEEKHYQTSLSPIRNTEGLITDIVGVGRDITKQVVIAEKLKIANETLKSLSFVDALTHIANRRYFDQRIKQEWKRALRKSRFLSVLMIDVDYFKEYNDTYGHPQGDECLKSIAATFKKSLHRPGDIIARYGGEEFIAILPETDEQGAVIVAEKLRANIENLAIPHVCSKVGPCITISVGVATVIPSSVTSIEEFIRKADQALYKAKQQSRNRVAV